MVPKPRSIRPESQSYLKPGSEVEITSDEPGFRGSFYTGTVIRRSFSKNTERFLVEYKNLFADESGKKPLREVLIGAQIRPLAPRERARVFKFSDEVDAYHNDGWWEGTITIDHGNGKFSVFFRKSREQIEFVAKDLRLHREWIDGVWKPPLEKEGDSSENEEDPSENEGDPSENEEDPQENKEDELITVPKRQKISPEPQPKANKTMANIKYGNGTSVEVSSDEEGFQGAWFSATIIKPCGNDKYLAEYKTLRSDDDKEFLKEEIDIFHIRPPPPEKVVIGTFNKLDEVDAFHNDGWWVGVISEVLTDSMYIVYFKGTEEHIRVHHSNVRLHQEWINGEWVTASQSLKL